MPPTTVYCPDLQVKHENCRRDCRMYPGPWSLVLHRWEGTGVAPRAPYEPLKESSKEEPVSACVHARVCNCMCARERAIVCVGVGVGRGGGFQRNFRDGALRNLQL